MADDRGHGHLFYAQNRTGYKIIKDNIALNSFGYGMHAFTAKNDTDDITFEGNITFNAGKLVDKDRADPTIYYSPASSAVIKNNVTYSGRVELHCPDGISRRPVSGSVEPTGSPSM